MDKIRFTLDGDKIPYIDRDPLRLKRSLKKYRKKNIHCENEDYISSHGSSKTIYGLRCILSTGALNNKCSHDVNVLIDTIQLANDSKINLNILFPDFFEHIRTDQLNYRACFELSKLQTGKYIYLEKITLNIDIDKHFKDYFTTPNLKDFILEVWHGYRYISELATNVRVNQNTTISLSNHKKAFKKFGKYINKETFHPRTVYLYDGLKDPINEKSKLFSALFCLTERFVNFFNIKNYLIKILNVIIINDSLPFKAEDCLETLLKISRYSEDQIKYFVENYYDLFTAVILSCIIANNDTKHISSIEAHVLYHIKCSYGEYTFEYKIARDPKLTIAPSIEFLAELYKLYRFDTNEIGMCETTRIKLNTELGIASGMRTKSAIKK